MLLATANVQAQVAGVVWTSRTSAANLNWRSVTYGNGTFVAVASSGTGNRVMTSTDGITWVSRSSSVDNFWKYVTFGNGLFVATAQTGTGTRVMTSPNGIDWTTRTSAADIQWNSVVYANGKFVAVAGSGTGNRLMTSTDGITWTIGSTEDFEWRSVAYGNGKFVSFSTNARMTSSNGTTWVKTNNAIINQWSSVTFGNGIFVVVANTGTGNRVMTSTDGSTWTARTSASDNNWQSVTYGDGMFVAVANSGTGDRIMTSSDGISWTSRSSATDNNWQSVTYGNGTFVAVSVDGKVMTSACIPFTPSVSISPSEIVTTSISESSTIIASASDTGGGSVTYTFYVNGENVQSGISDTYNTSGLQGGDVVSCDISVSGGACLSATTASSEAVTVTCPVSSITTSSIVAGITGVSYSQTIAQTGFLSPSWSATGLPSGLTIDETTGVISGTTTESGTFSVAVTASEMNCTASQTYSLIIRYTPAALTGLTSNVAVVNGMLKVTFNWLAVSGASSYMLFYRPAGTLTWLKKQVSSNELIMSNFEGTKTYSWRVKYIKDGVHSLFSTVQKFTTPANFEVSTCGLPENLVATVSGSDVSFTWSGANPTPTAYRLEVRLKGTSVWTSYSANSWNNATITLAPGTYLWRLGSRYFVGGVTTTCGNVSGAEFTILGAGRIGKSTNDVAFDVFPNPSSDKVSFTFAGADNSSISLTIVDAIGRTVYQAKSESVLNETVDFSKLSKGVYIANIATEGTVQTKKFVIE